MYRFMTSPNNRIRKAREESREKRQTIQDILVMSLFISAALLIFYVILFYELAS